jgi:hypothetical protein
VGRSRRAGVRHVLDSVASPGQLWLASTDADSRVPAHWLPSMLDYAEHDADVVLGTVRPTADLPPHVASAWYAEHRLGDGHPHVHGANLGVRASTYLAAGGWPPLRTGEDIALVSQAMGVAGVRVERTDDLAVVTSTRLVARAPSGFSSYLRGLTQDAAGAASV